MLLRVPSQVQVQPSLPAGSIAAFPGVVGPVRSATTALSCHRRHLETDRQNRTTGGDCAAGPRPGGDARAHVTVRDLSAPGWRRTRCTQREADTLTFFAPRHPRVARAAAGSPVPTCPPPHFACLLSSCSYAPRHWFRSHALSTRVRASRVRATRVARRLKSSHFLPASDSGYASMSSASSFCRPVTYAGEAELLVDCRTRRVINAVRSVAFPGERQRSAARVVRRLAHSRLFPASVQGQGQV